MFENVKILPILARCLLLITDFSRPVMKRKNNFASKNIYRKAHSEYDIRSKSIYEREKV